jgi:hypothetical protein
MIGIIVGAIVASGALANEPSKPVTMPRGVSYTLPWEWDYLLTTLPSNQAVLTNGAGILFVTVDDRADANAVLQDLRNTKNAESPLLSTMEIAPVTDLREGDQVLEFTYSGEDADFGPIEGEATAIAGDNYVVIFDSFTQYGDYFAIEDQIEATIEGATIP